MSADDPINIRSRWADRDTHQAVIVTDYDPTRADRPVFFVPACDPGYGAWLPDVEFLSQFELVPKEEE